MLTLADDKTKLAILTVEPADITAVTTTELAAGLDAAQHVNKPDFRMSPTGSDTVPDQPLGQGGNAKTWGNSNAEASMTLLRDLTALGAGQPLVELIWEAAKTKGAILYLIKREGPVESVDWADGDDYEYMKVVTDEPQNPSNMGGFTKRTIPLGPQAWGTGVVVDDES
jgi:hypothetical protein